MSTKSVSTTSGDVELLASRLAVFVSVMVGIRVATLLVLSVAELVTGAPDPWWNRGSGLASLVSTLVLAGLALALRRVRMPPRALRAIDAAPTILLALAAAFSIPIDPSVPAPLRASSLESHELKAVLIVVHLLLLRAALIPSHPWRTAGLGVAATLVLSAGTTLAHARAACRRCAPRHFSTPSCGAAFR